MKRIGCRKRDYGKIFLANIDSDDEDKDSDNRGKKLKIRPRVYRRKIINRAN